MSAIYFHEYEMRSRGPLNTRSERDAFRGALLRVGDGFGCLHPWPELGDLEIDAQLECLREARPTPLIARTLRCAGLDALARREGRSLFEGLTIPCSHATLLDESIEPAVEARFAAIKLKCGPRLGEERERVDEIAARLGGTEVALRLDFNESLDEHGFCELWGSLSGETRERIEFVEDPFPYAAEAWERAERERGVKLAVDRRISEAAAKGMSYAVIKPAIDDVETLAPLYHDAGKRLVFTSYMDHPLGQMYAAFEAARAGATMPLEICGLLTHALFEKNAFVERVRSEGPKLLPTEGTGLGFDDLLESLPWKKLT